MKDSRTSTSSDLPTAATPNVAPLFTDVVESATIGLLRVAVVFGLTSSLVLLVMAALGGHALSILVTIGWSVIWAAALIWPHALAWSIREHSGLFTLSLSLLSAAAIVATGGIESVSIVEANWFVWAASIVASTRVVVVLACSLSASHFVAFLLSGMPLSDVVGSPDSYQIVTQTCNPLVIAEVALALIGVFRKLMIRTPKLLARWRAAPNPQVQLESSRPLELPPAAVPTPRQPTGHPAELLTPAESDVVARLADGAKPKQIAHDTRRSTATIYEHIANAKRKCAARTTAQLVTRAWRPTG